MVVIIRVNIFITAFDPPPHFRGRLRMQVSICPNAACFEDVGVIGRRPSFQLIQSSRDTLALETYVWDCSGAHPLEVRRRRRLLVPCRCRGVGETRVVGSWPGSRSSYHLGLQTKCV